MSKEQFIQSFKEALIAACDAHLAKGGKIIAGSFGGKFSDGVNCLCPLSCLIPNPVIVHGVVSYSTSLVRSNFPMERESMWAFIDGFDNRPRPDLDNVTDGTSLYALGQELRGKYITV